MKTAVKSIQFDIRYLIAILSAVLIFGGLYFKFLYDVPDGEEITNLWISWLLVVLGIIGIMATALYKKKRKPLVEDFDDNDYGNYGTDYNTNESRGAAENP
jgi:hypothetical protein